MTTSFTYFGCRVAPRDNEDAIRLAVFPAFAKDVLQWAGIRRIGETDKGVQRILKDTRVKAIKRFLQSDQRNTIPTSIILAFSPGSAEFTGLEDGLAECAPGIDVLNGLGARLSWGTISFSLDSDALEADRPALIVDGQHRLVGMNADDEDLPVLIVALLDASPEEQAFQFVVINNKAAKVPTDNVKGIIADFDEENLRLVPFSRGFERLDPALFFAPLV
jgi:DGQHR domain-containing protein